MAAAISTTALAAEFASNSASRTNSRPGVTFEQDIRPLFKAACFHCHGEAGVVEGGLDLRLARFTIKGGETGPSLVAGDREKSLLYQRVRDGEMPPDKAHRFTPEQVELLGKWIEAGAPTLRPEPESLDTVVITEEERSHWSFQPITKPAVPKVAHQDQVSTPVDAFLLQKLEEKGFAFSESASKRNLVRRVYIDLLGLPPTPEQLKAFEEDTRPDAWEQLVEQLLASPHYGERWGRHWLDVAGYADSDGYSNQDPQRKFAWRYRDYVIKSFNADKPFDQFILEQLAGDELITSPLNNLSPEDAELLAATGFLRMAPDGTSGTVDDQNVAKNDVVAETIKIVTSSLMGLTVGCAQCHDHRYDPIPTVDYYRLRAVFEPALNWKQWRTPQQRLVSLYNDEDRKKAAEIEAQAKVIDAARLEKQQAAIDAEFEKQLLKLPEEIRDSARGLHKVPVKDRTPEQKALVKTYPALNISAGSLYLYNPQVDKELKAMLEEAKKVRETKPKEEFIHALVEPKAAPPATFVFYRGDCDQPKDQVSPGGLTVIEQASQVPPIPVKDASLPTTGRRRAFAKQLTDRKHPLTSRVLVNRIWLHHFGRGLVESPADFGILGIPPTHPELLDWLASEFMDSGWSMKHLHRLMVNSHAYRQALRSSPEQDQVDPENRLYGGARLVRLDAETIRDSVLSVSGILNTDMYGPPVPIMSDDSGRWILGVENLVTGRPGPIIPLEGRENLRSVYVEVRRSRPLAVLDTFDWPIMSPNCEIRRTSTNTPQSLMLMNSDFVLEHSAKFARRIESVAGDDVAAQIDTAWQLTFLRAPDESERSTAKAFLEEQEQLMAERVKTLPAPKDKSKAPTPKQLALDCLCQMLLSSNEFLYVD